MAPRGARDLATLALAALSVAAGLSLGRVFGDSGYALPVVGAALLPHALGIVARRRGWRLAGSLGASAAALAIYVAWVVTPATTWFGFPTSSSASTLWRLLGDGYDDLQNARVPADVTDGALLLAVLAMWVVAQSADVIAFRRDGTIGAIAPALALFVWSSSLGTGELRGRTTLTLAAAATLFLLCQHQALLEQRRARFAGRRLGSGTGLLGVGAVVGALAVVGGAVLGPALPGASSEALVDVKDLGDSGGGGSGARSYAAEPPLAVIGANFQAPAAVELFRVETSRPEYWRIAALDQYSSDQGGQWTLNAAGDGEVDDALERPVADDTFRQQYEIVNLDGRWMPAAYRPMRLEGSDVLVVKASDTLVTGADTVRGQRYVVDSLVPLAADAVGPEQSAATQAPVPPDKREYTSLPSDFPADVVALARDVTAGAATPFDQADALEQFFSPANGFEYSITADVELGSTAQSESAIAEFVLERKVGFCVQFAGSFAAMARAVGIPARVAVGYTPGDYDERRSTYVVDSWDAHAWPEVWLAGLGWTRFEPTPPSSEPGGSDLPGRESAPENKDPATPTTVASTAAPSPGSGAPPAPGPDAEVSIDAPDGSSGDGDGRWWTANWRLLAAAVVLGVVAVVGAGLAIVAAKARRRATRRARAAPGDALAGAWAEALDRLGEAGIAPRSSWTPLELAAAATGRVPPAAATSLRSLAVTYGAARYGPAPPAPDLARTAWLRVDEISAALVADAGRRERWRRRLDPTPLRRR